MKKINKLFRNGSIQVICKSVDLLFDTINILCKERIIKKRVIEK